MYAKDSANGVQQLHLCVMLWGLLGAEALGEKIMNGISSQILLPLSCEGYVIVPTQYTQGDGVKVFNRMFSLFTNWGSCLVKEALNVKEVYFWFVWHNDILVEADQWSYSTARVGGFSICAEGDHIETIKVKKFFFFSSIMKLGSQILKTPN